MMQSQEVPLFMKQKQIEWVNIAKGLTMIGIVVWHITYELPNHELFPLRTLLFHLNVFFVIGGFFTKEETLLQPVAYITRKYHTLYKKLLIFYIPAVLLHNFLFTIGFYDVATEYGGRVIATYGIIDYVKNVFLAILFSGREPILGAMWFVYALFLAHCGFSVISWALRVLVTDNNHYEVIRCFIFFLLCVLAIQLKNIWGIYVPRGNASLYAIWLLYLGYQMRNRFNLQFRNIWLLAISLIIVYCVAIEAEMGGYDCSVDAVPFTVNTLAATYVTCYIARILDNRRIGKAIAFCGRNSFYIMALHLFCFKLGTLLLSLFGIERSLSAERAPADGSFLLFCFYLVVGVVFPLLLVCCFRKVWALIASDEKDQEHE